jgi:hypothetical protein
MLCIAEGNKLLEKFRHRWKDIKRDLQEMEYVWTELICIGRGSCGGLL